MDKVKTIEELKQVVKDFNDKRDWEQFHTPKDLAEAISIEASELLEHFLWVKSDKSKEKLEGEDREEIVEELADIFCFLLRFAELNNIDLSEALIAKMEKNDKKYPVDKAKGNSTKYNKL